MGQTKTLDDRIGIGKGAQQQRKHRVDNQKAQDCQQQSNPQASHDAPASTLTAAVRDPGSANPAFLSLRSPWTSSLGDHATAGKVAESRGVTQSAINGEVFDTAAMD